MGVKEELEALRNKGVTKNYANKLKNASGLSTPEAEENAIKAEHERTRIGNYGKEADGNLKSYNEAKVAVAKNTPIQKAPKTEEVAKPAEESAPEKVEEVDDVPTLEEVPDMEEIPSLETAGAGTVPEPAAVAPPVAPVIINRAERKARRMMEKLGSKKVPGISQVVLKMRGGGARGGVFTIAAPDVFEKNGSYIIFGEARQGGGGAGSTQAQQAQAIQQLAALAKSDGGIEMPAVAAAAEGDSATVEEVDAAAVDAGGLEEKDIDLVITQAGCSRAKAVQALKDNDGDLVNAIMSLTA